MPELAEWVRSEAGIELAYAEITSDAAINATGAPALVAGLSVVAIVGARPVKAIFSAQSIRHNTATSWVGVILFEDGAQVGSTFFFHNANTLGLNVPVHREVTRRPLAGAHTYEIRGLVASGIGTIEAAAADPATLQVVEC